MEGESERRIGRARKGRKGGGGVCFCWRRVTSIREVHVIMYMFVSI